MKNFMQNYKTYEEYGKPKKAKIQLYVGDDHC